MHLWLRPVRVSPYSGSLHLQVRHASMGLCVSNLDTLQSANVVCLLAQRIFPWLCGCFWARLHSAEAFSLHVDLEAVNSGQEQQQRNQKGSLHGEEDKGILRVMYVTDCDMSASFLSALQVRDFWRAAGEWCTSPIECNFFVRHANFCLYDVIGSLLQDMCLHVLHPNAALYLVNVPFRLRLWIVVARPWTRGISSFRR